MIEQQNLNANAVPQSTTFPPGFDVQRVTAYSGDGFGRLRRRSAPAVFYVRFEGRVIATWATEKQARRHASGVPVVQRQFGGAWWLWRGERAEVFVTKEAAQAARRRKEAVNA